MEFLLLFTAPTGSPEPTPVGMAEMGRFSAELARQGKLRRGAPLASPSSSAWVRVRDGRVTVSDGPFAETKELVGGFWVIEAASREEALDIASRTPHASHAVVEVHAIEWRDAVPDPGKGTPFLLAFRMEPGLCDPGGSKRAEMIEFGAALEEDGTTVETAPLAEDPAPARVEVRRGRLPVTDGPFAEAKGAIGGYAVVRVGGRAEAIARAKRYPHPRWGPIEVCEIPFFDPL
jgi:hypothetical protein